MSAIGPCCSHCPRRAGVGFHAGAPLQHLLPQPATTRNCASRWHSTSTVSDPTSASTRRHYLFRALRGDVRVGSQAPMKARRDVPARRRRGGDLFAFYRTILGFLRRRSLGVYATQYGVQRWPRLAMGRFWRLHGEIVITFTAFIAAHRLTCISSWPWRFHSASSALHEFWMSGTGRHPRENGRPKPEDNWHMPSATHDRPAFSPHS